MGKKKVVRLKAAVIGYGGAFNMGRKHLEEMKQAGMEPTAICDLDESRLATAQEDFPGIETYTSIATMLKKTEADIVTIITPHNLHAKQAIQCLKAGKHVVVEKPMAITTAECDRMIAEAKKQKLVLSTYHNRHWDGCILKALKMIKSGKIGKVVRIDCQFGNRGKPRAWWRSSKSISGGLLYDWGVHLTEYALQIIDSELQEVSGYLHSGYWARNGNPFKTDSNEDEGSFVARFKNGVWFNLTMTSLNYSKRADWFEVVGTEGTYYFSGGNWRLVQTKKNNTVVTTEGMSDESEGWRFYQNVADHLTKGEKLVITPEWARRPIHILDLACKSSKQGKALKAKYQ